MPLSERCKHLDAILKLKIRYLFIPHPFATNICLGYPINMSVRLACLSHAASVHSEPGSNSSICIVESAPKDSILTLLEST